MRYDQKQKILYSAAGEPLKVLFCPLNKRWADLAAHGPNDEYGFIASDCKRYCQFCEKAVINVTEFDEHQVAALLKVDPAACIYASAESEYITFEGEKNKERINLGCSKELDEPLPIIYTARTVEAINNAVKQGFWPLIETVKPNPDIQQKRLVYQLKDGSIIVESDFRGGFAEEAKYLGEFWINPYHSPEPFAAYLIPLDLPESSRVFLPDLIEDQIDSGWNQGDRYRRQSGYATWQEGDLILETHEWGEIMG